VERDALSGISVPKPSFEMVGVDAAGLSGRNRTWKVTTPSFGWRPSRQVTTRKASTVEGRKEPGRRRERRDLRVRRLASRVGVTQRGVKIMQGGERLRLRVCPLEEPRREPSVTVEAQGGARGRPTTRTSERQEMDHVELSAYHPASWKIRQCDASCAHTKLIRTSSLSSTG
jgi:hypothetical protein